MHSSMDPRLPPGQNPDAKAGTIAVALVLFVILLIGVSGMLIAEAEQDKQCPLGVSVCAPQTTAAPYRAPPVTPKP